MFYEICAVTGRSNFSLLLLCFCSAPSDDGPREQSRAGHRRCHRRLHLAHPCVCAVPLPVEVRHARSALCNDSAIQEKAQSKENSHHCLKTILLRRI